MEIGVNIPQAGRLAEVSAVRAAAVAAERRGLASLWVRDAVFTTGEDGPRPGVLDPIGALHVAAACTDEIRLGTSVLVGPWYPPLLLARALTTLGEAAGGRVTVGLGLGWDAGDYRAVGVPRRHLATRLDELLDVLDAVWADDPVFHTGARIELGPASVQPKPRPRLPVLLAARTPAGLDRIARRADGWTVGALGLDAIGSMWRALRDLTAGYGRDPHALRLVVRGDVRCTSAPLGHDRSSFSGSIEQIACDVAAARAIGAHELVFDVAGGAATATEVVDLSCEVIAAAA